LGKKYYREQKKECLDKHEGIYRSGGIQFHIFGQVIINFYNKGIIVIQYAVWPVFQEIFWMKLMSHIILGAPSRKSNFEIDILGFVIKNYSTEDQYGDKQ
jgi:hypothetical protein